MYALEDGIDLTPHATRWSDSTSQAKEYLIVGFAAIEAETEFVQVT